VGPEASALREKVALVTAAGIKNLVLNLAVVDYIDSTGLGALVMCATTMRKNAGVVKLLNLNRRNIELLVMTSLATPCSRSSTTSRKRYQLPTEAQTFDMLSFVRT